MVSVTFLEVCSLKFVMCMYLCMYNGYFAKSPSSSF